jgi:hypothetical protein
MTFTPKAWGNPLSTQGDAAAADLTDLEVRLSNYTDTVGDHDMSPADYGLLAWTGNPEYSQQSLTFTGGKVYLTKMKVPTAITIASLRYAIGIQGVDGGAVLANCFMGVYNQSGSALLGQTADQTTNLKSAANTIINAAVTAESGQSLTVPKGYVWIAALVGTQSSTACAVRSFISASSPTNFGTSGATLRSLTTAPTGQSALPSSVTISTGTVALSMVFGVTAA